MLHGIKGDEENKRVSTYQPKSSDHFLKGLIFHIGGGADNRAHEKWILSSTQGPQHCGRGFDIDRLPRTRADEGYFKSFDLPVKKGMKTFDVKYSKLGGGRGVAM